jgi:hypothetical protein
MTVPRSIIVFPKADLKRDELKDDSSLALMLVGILHSLLGWCVSPG